MKGFLEGLREIKTNPEIRKELERRAEEAKEQLQDGANNPAKERVILPSSKSMRLPVIPAEQTQQQKSQK